MASAVWSSRRACSAPTNSSRASARPWIARTRLISPFPNTLPDHALRCIAEPQSRSARRAPAPSMCRSPASRSQEAGRRRSMCSGISADTALCDHPLPSERPCSPRKARPSPPARTPTPRPPHTPSCVLSLGSYRVLDPASTDRMPHRPRSGTHNRPARLPVVSALPLSSLHDDSRIDRG